MDETPSRIRLTISVTPEVHASYLRLAKAANLSIGRAMGDWLADMQDAALYSAAMLEQARQAPKDAIRQLNQATAALAAQGEELTERIRARADAQPVRADRREHARASGAPSSLTGLNPPSKRKRV
jgi:hypothetical protein